MTDNDIIKALECCCGEGWRVCGDCPRLDVLFGKNAEKCTDGLLKEAVDLINRQKEQIEALIAGQETLQKYIAEQKVRHGVWVWDVETHGDLMYGVDEDFGYRCSECKVWADEWGVDGDIYEEPPTRLHYCPNCGAYMRGDNNG